MVSLGEFVFEIYDDDEPLGSGERIIRCRDCAYFDGDCECEWFAYFEESGAIYPALVRPDGFCAWAIEEER